MSIPQSMMPIMQALAQLGPQVSQMGPAAQVQNVKFQQPTRNPIATGAALGLGQPPAGGNAGPLQAATLAYGNTQSQRMPGAAGAMESLWDAFREKGKRAELAEQTQIAADQAAQKEAQEKLKAQEEAMKTSDAVYKVAIDNGYKPEIAKQFGQLSMQNPKIAEALMKEMTNDDRTAPEKNAEAMGLQPGSPEYNQYIREATISKSNIHQYAPQLPAGYRWKGDVGGEMEVIPGSPPHTAMVQQQQRDRSNVIQATAAVENQIKQVERALEKTGVMTAGFFGSLLSNIKGTPAASLAEMLKTPQAIVAFDRLQEMRQASATGGALGNVSNREIELLYSSWAALDQGMEPAELEKSLKDVRDRFIRVQYALENDARHREMDTKDVLADINNHMDELRAMEGNVPPEALEALKNDPKLRNDFESKYGYLPSG